MSEQATVTKTRAKANRVAGTGTLVKTNGNGHPPAPIDLPEDFLLRIARDTTIDADKLRAVADVYVTMQEKQRAWVREDDKERARVAYFAAKPAMQAELPVLEKTTPNQEGKGKYLDYGELWETCCPIWTKHGFTVAFDIVPTDNGLIRVKLILDHTAGHRETFLAPDTPPDTAGPKGTPNKTVPQGNQATITFVQRGLLTRALGIGMKREEDDGNSGATGDHRAAPHTTRTERRYADDRPPVNWVDSTVELLDAAKTLEAWETRIIQALRNPPSVTEVEDLKSRLRAAVNGIHDRAVRNRIADAFRAASGSLAPSAESKPRSAEGEDADRAEAAEAQAALEARMRSSAEALRQSREARAASGAPEWTAPLSDDEQWAENQISDLSLVSDMNTFLVMANAAETQKKMKTFSTTNRPLYERVKAAYEAAQTRISREAAR
jgi:hypothetical protein